MELEIIRMGMNRQQLLLIVFTSVTAAALASSPEEGGKESKPNISIIISDEYGYADDGCNGSWEYNTPQK